MAIFLESRGLTKELAAAFDGQLEKYAKNDERRFLDFLGEMFNFGAPHYAKTAATAWAGDNEERWTEIFAVLLGNNETIAEWMDWIRDVQPDISNPETLEVVMALYKVGHDPDGLRVKWMDRAWNSVESADEESKAQLIERIRSLSIVQQDVENSLKAWGMTAEPTTSMWNSIDKFLSAAGRWDEAAEIIDASGKIATSSSPENHAYLAATLRRAGLEKRAAEHDRWAEKLSLGYPPSCKRIGDCYTYGGDPERAAIWYQRAAFQTELTSMGFMAGFERRSLKSGVLATYATSMMEQGNWEIAASCFEALMSVLASRDYVRVAPEDLAKVRLSADLAKALTILPEDRNRAISLLEGIHNNFSTDGVLADDFFPMIRKAGLTDELNRWFSDSWEKISAVIDKYPESDNSRNTAAWFASRAGLQLEKAQEHLEFALARNPDQPAYLDTMAELHFAGGDRKTAIEWSDRAIMFYPLTDPTSTAAYDLMIRKQNHRFHFGEAP